MRDTHRLAWLLALFLVVSCAEGLGGILISDAKEVEIGAAVDLEIEKEYRIVEATDPATVWAEQVVAGLEAASTSFRDPAEIGGYKVEVIYDEELINAFAAPGGWVYITTPLILEASSCAELAGVLGHELAHVTERHGVKQLEGAVAVGLLSDLILGEGIAGDVAEGIWAFISNTTWSQDNEEDADSIGLQIAKAAGYNPYGLADFFKKLAEAGDIPDWLTWMSSHPQSAEREKAVSDEIQRRYGDAVVRGADSPGAEYGCVGTNWTLAQLKEHINSGNLAIRAGTGIAPSQ